MSSANWFVITPSAPAGTLGRVVLAASPSPAAVPRKVSPRIFSGAPNSSTAADQSSTATAETTRAEASASGVPSRNNTFPRPESTGASPIVERPSRFPSRSYRAIDEVRREKPSASSKRKPPSGNATPPVISPPADAAKPVTFTGNETPS